MDAAQALARLADYFETMTPESVGRIGDYYAPDARFKDPFNDVRGVPAIRQVFHHMFGQVGQPRFIVTERIGGEGGDGSAVLLWQFHFTARFGLRERPQSIHGASHLRFDGAGLVVLHRDYWDAAEELYAKLPVLGPLMRALSRKLAA
ncbi:nuclear transport factor 2 family protein [Noviherbaspirillum soli]|uniref:nuclear transport factor 2 family protein n=1 Tax=Noviherbaspirillum soli TaxID=1064518 RepID=UPI00188C97E6|nr:nuclear transport factor 2 family protein [Noviherbaspirillum soli]